MQQDQYQSRVFFVVVYSLMSIDEASLEITRLILDSK